METYIASGTEITKGGAVLSKMRGWLAKFRQYKFLASVHLFHLTLQETAHMPYEMQKADATIIEIRDALATSIEKIESLEVQPVEDDHVDLPFLAEMEGDQLVVRLACAHGCCL